MAQLQEVFIVTFDLEIDSTRHVVMTEAALLQNLRVYLFN